MRLIIKYFSMLTSQGMKHIAICTLTIYAVAFCIGCGATRILRADFDLYDGFPQDDLGLIGNLPGLPSGPNSDRILDTDPIVKVHNFQSLSGKNLMITGLDPPIGIPGAGEGRIVFDTATHEPADEYRMNWDGRRLHPDKNDWTKITFMDTTGEDKTAFELRFSGVIQGDINVMTILAGGQSQPEPITYSAIGANHTLFIILNAKEKKFSVTFREHFLPGDQVTQRKDLPILNPDFTKLDQIIFEVENIDATYFLDDLDVLAFYED